MAVYPRTYSLILIESNESKQFLDIKNVNRYYALELIESNRGYNIINSRIKEERATDVFRVFFWAQSWYYSSSLKELAFRELFFDSSDCIPCL